MHILAKDPSLSQKLYAPTIVIIVIIWWGGGGGGVERVALKETKRLPFVDETI